MPKLPTLTTEQQAIYDSLRVYLTYEALSDMERTYYEADGRAPKKSELVAAMVEHSFNQMGIELSKAYDALDDKGKRAVVSHLKSIVKGML